MRSLPLWAGALAVLVTVQSSFLPEEIFFGCVPDFVLLSVVLVAMRAGGTTMMLWAVAAGLFQDVLSGGIIGMNTLSKPLAGTFVMLVRWKLDFRNPNTQSMVAFLATLADGLFLSFLVNAYLPARDIPGTVLGDILPASAMNGIIFPLFLTVEEAVLRWRQRSWRRAQHTAD